MAAMFTHRSTMTTSTPATYSAPARAFHWATALLMTLQFTVGWWMPEVDDMDRPQGLVDLHLSLGVLLLALVALRLLWRGLSARPESGTGGPVYLQWLAAAAHAALYALMIALPVLGWANASARGWPVTLFGAIGLPPLLPNGSDFGMTLGDIHVVLAWALLGLTGLHVLAVVFHHRVLKENLLQRMIPSFARGAR
jgi:cytochrome b561